MQHEFNDRIAAQRAILKVVNANSWKAEDLFGLSHKSIERWVSVNRLDPNSRLIDLVKEASKKLFFLANKSQEQITSEYERTSSEVSSIRDAIEVELAGVFLSRPTPLY